MALPLEVTKFTFNSAILAIYLLPLFVCATSSNGEENTCIFLPPILSSCLSPLSPSATIRWAKDLSHQKTLKNASSFCNEGGLICDESITTPSSNLHRFSTYRPPKTKNANSLQFDDMFFKESLLSIGSLIKLPMQEPHIPTRAFLPPLLEPQLFNHSTSPFLHVLQTFGFHPGTPLANSMHETLQICNLPPPLGERKACAATFEAMLDFAASSIGSADMTILSGASLPPEQIVVVTDLREVTNGGERVAVACHNAMFPFQVFYCHHIHGTKVFNVMLQTTINMITNISAVASCHPLHTSPYSPSSSHTNFQQKELLCHWNYGDNFVWIPTTSLSFPSIGYTQWRGLSLMNPSHVGKI